MKYLIVFIGLLVSACSSEMNARAYPDKIVITGKMMEFTKNHTERSFVLSHEVCHILLGHTEELFWTGQEMKDREIDADKCAVNMLQYADQDVCLITDFYERIIDSKPKYAKALRARVETIKTNCKG